jgi:acyl carrier protein
VPIRADVADAHALRAAVGDALQGQTLRGIFHAAGVRRDKSLLRMTWEDVAPVLEAKHAGAWNLHQLTQEHPVEHFVLFSSVAASMGSAGQANYAAANAFLDALAHLRRANGQVALSVDWGPWAEVGMAAKEGLTERLAGLGFPALATRDAFDALGRLLAWRETPAQVGIAGLRLAALRVARSGPVVDRLLGALLSEAETPAPNGEFVSRERLSTTPPPELERVVTDDLFARLCRILRTHKEHEGDLRRGFETRVLGELGLDSLMAVELRNRLLSDLGVDVPMHVMLGGGRVTDIVDLVCVQVKLHALVASNDGGDEGADEETYVI